MILSFADAATRDIFEGRSTRRARQRLPFSSWRRARRKLDQLNAASVLEDLSSPPGNHLEALVGDRAGQCSIRIDRQYRICFCWTDDGPARVEIVDYH